MKSAESDFIKPAVGFAALCSIMIFVVVWLITRGADALKPAAQILPAPHASQDLQQTSQDLRRFRADAWFLPNDPLLGFVEIPAGEFLIGSNPEADPQAFASERWSPQSYQGRIDLPAFYIGRFEVTVAQFRAFAEAAQHRVDVDALRAPPTHPVANVSWTDALAYARWLNAALAASPQTPAPLAELLHAGWRVAIPSEAQWEKAARGVDGRIFPWGNEPSRDYSNISGTISGAGVSGAGIAVAGAIAVGSLRCIGCSYGLSDMSGNVWELTRSPYRPYPFDDRTRGDFDSEALFVMRGGSFNDAPGSTRAAVRGGVDPGVRRYNIGFRVVLEKQ